MHATAICIAISSERSSVMHVFIYISAVILMRSVCLQIYVQFWKWNFFVDTPQLFHVIKVRLIYFILAMYLRTFLSVGKCPSKFKSILEINSQRTKCFRRWKKTSGSKLFSFLHKQFQKIYFWLLLSLIFWFRWKRKRVHKYATTNNQ